jgi:hypothetical protein
MSFLVISKDSSNKIYTTDDPEIELESFTNKEEAEYYLQFGKRKIIIKNKENPINHCQRWLQEEEEKLLMAIDSGFPNEIIAETFGRSIGGITSRIRVIAVRLYKDGKTFEEIKKITKLSDKKLNECISRYDNTKKYKKGKYIEHTKLKEKEKKYLWVYHFQKLMDDENIQKLNLDLKLHQAKFVIELLSPVIDLQNGGRGSQLRIMKKNNGTMIFQNEMMYYLQFHVIPEIEQSCQEAYKQNWTRTRKTKVPKIQVKSAVAGEMNLPSLMIKKGHKAYEYLDYIIRFSNGEFMDDIKTYLECCQKY